MGQQMLRQEMMLYPFFNRCQAREVSQHTTQGADPGTDLPKARLYLKKLDQLATGFFSRGLAVSTLH